MIYIFFINNGKLTFPKVYPSYNLVQYTIANKIMVTNKDNFYFSLFNAD